jgi:acetyl-CoA carboxylase carboxyltransferase component
MFQGRRVVAVANDLTFQSGAFSPKEDALFRGAAELALEERLPLVYLAANSGEFKGRLTGCIRSKDLSRRPTAHEPPAEA